MSYQNKTLIFESDKIYYKDADDSIEMQVMVKYILIQTVRL